MLAPGRAKPKPTPETRHFWDGAKEGKLLLQRCGDTGRAYFPPRPFSPF
ncbi:MAG: DNA-binding protein, partial [Acetobacteraceae bacterium]|nr:DNA-binding protein [Acetobacteraceae bacterium]